METKAKIRKRQKCLRNSLTEDDFRLLSKQICQRIMSIDDYLDADIVFLYASANHEVDLGYICQKALLDGKTVAFPRVVGENMNFHKIFNTSELLEGYFGIMEPCEGNEIVRPTESSIILVPGLAFSLEGHRIGYGKGFYDRYLSCYPYLKSFGVGYDFQIESAWEADTLDIPLKGIITEKREVFL